MYINTVLADETKIHSTASHVQPAQLLGHVVEFFEVNMQDIWRDIPGYDGHYQASNLGNIKSFKYNIPRILKQADDGDGYLAVNLAHNKARKTLKIHRLILLTWIGECPVGCEGSHLNGDRLDNRLCNLAWETKQANTYRKILHDLIKDYEQA